MCRKCQTGAQCSMHFVFHPRGDFYFFKLCKTKALLFRRENYRLFDATFMNLRQDFAGQGRYAGALSYVCRNQVQGDHLYSLGDDYFR